jgi:hypothetical protein
VAAIVSPPIRNDVLDVSRPPSHEPVWKLLFDWVAAAAGVVIVVLALIALGLPIVLLVRWIVTALSWLMSG